MLSCFSKDLNIKYKVNEIWDSLSLVFDPIEEFFLNDLNSINLDYDLNDPIEISNKQSERKLLDEYLYKVFQ